MIRHDGFFMLGEWPEMAQVLNRFAVADAPDPLQH